MNILDDTTLLFRIAKYYYVDDYSQNEIAQIENISRPQISRLLKRARDAGIVKIEVLLPDSLDRHTMANDLKYLLNLDNIIISPSSNDEKENDAGLYTLAALNINKILGNCKNVGIGWGKTMYNIALNLSYQENYQDLSFYPVIGNSGTNNPYLQTNSITDRFAERFRAIPYYNNALFLSDKSSFSRTEKDRFEELKSCWKTLDAVIIGIGVKVLSSKSYLDVLLNIIDDDIKEDILGDVLGRFFLQDLSEFNIPESYETVSVELSHLSKIRNVICIANGEHKVDAIICACKKGIINSLITDEMTGKLILKALKYK